MTTRSFVGESKVWSFPAGSVFFGALDWIFRHELAHITRCHAERQHTEGLTDQQCEAEADQEATRWLRGERRADKRRPADIRPSDQELQLEARAVSVGL